MNSKKIGLKIFELMYYWSLLISYGFFVAMYAPKIAKALPQYEKFIFVCMLIIIPLGWAYDKQHGWDK